MAQGFKDKINMQKAKCKRQKSKVKKCGTESRLHFCLLPFAF
jgi:hypothetical protein